MNGFSISHPHRRFKHQTTGARVAPLQISYLHVWPTPSDFVIAYTYAQRTVLYVELNRRFRFAIGRSVPLPLQVLRAASIAGATTVELHFKKSGHVLAASMQRLRHRGHRLTLPHGDSSNWCLPDEFWRINGSQPIFDTVMCATQEVIA